MRITEIINEAVNPDILHPDFHHEQEIGDYRYAAFYYKPHEKNPAKLRIECYDGDKRVGVATFAVTDDALVSDVTQVLKKYQGQKISTTMYAYAKMLGNDIIPSAELTDDGKAMWDAWHKSGEAAHIMPHNYNQ